MNAIWKSKLIRGLPTWAWLFFSILVLAQLCLGSAAGLARTIEMTDADCDRMACIGLQAPRSSWMMTELGAGEYSTLFLDIKSERSFLIRYPLDRIPPGQRITRAEWILPISIVNPPADGRLYVRRIIGPWGVGVCHDFRMQRPKKLPWTVPGAGGASTDRATQASVIARVKPGEVTINVTEDVELWYTGAAENQGWIVTVEDPALLVRVHSPLWAGTGLLKLRITYEPE